MSSPSIVRRVAVALVVLAVLLAGTALVAFVGDTTEPEEAAGDSAALASGVEPPVATTTTEPAPSTTSSTTSSTSTSTTSTTVAETTTTTTPTTTSTTTTTTTTPTTTTTTTTTAAGGGGQIGNAVELVSASMSNAASEFGSFDSRYGGGTDVVLINGSQGGCAGSNWAEPIGSNSCWTNLQRSLGSVDPAEVEYVWTKLAHRFKHLEVAPPDQIAVEIGINRTALQNLLDFFPNATIYLSGRSYGGHGQEPYDYEYARDNTFSVVPALVAEFGRVVEGPMLYVEDDERSYFRGDGIHPDVSTSIWADRLCSLFCSASWW